jgi:hypothetical protein
MTIGNIHHFFCSRNIQNVTKISLLLTRTLKLFEKIARKSFALIRANRRIFSHVLRLHNSGLCQCNWGVNETN